MSKFECTNSRCIYGCKLEVNGQKKAPEKCQYTGMETHWVRVESEQFGNSEQLEIETFMGFKVPEKHDMQHSVNIFNIAGTPTFGCLEAKCVCDCSECILCCNFGDRDAKIKAFAEYAKSKGFAITRPGYVAEPVTDCNQLPKLTAEVFDREDCPDWAKYAAVDACGTLRLFSWKPWLGKSCWNWTQGEVTQVFGVKFDASDWQHSIVQRPKPTTDGKRVIRFKKLHPDAKEPYQATPGSAGFDLTAVTKIIDEKMLFHYGTGIAVEIPAGHVGLVFPRSSIYKEQMTLTNCVGVIDSDYRGEIKAVFSGKGMGGYKTGDRIAQLVIVPIPAVKFVEAEELTETQRGTGGYGSTGR